MILSTYKIKDMEMMIVEKERKIKTLSLVTLIVAVLGLTVAFAALSQTLTINGTASVDAASWDIHFENLSEPKITGAAEVIETPTLTNDSFDGLNVKLTKPGDSVTYTFDIVNKGTIAAKIDEEATDKLSDDLWEILCNHDYNGDGIITSADEFFGFDMDHTTSSSFGEDLIIEPNEVVTISVTIIYYPNITELPAEKEFTLGPITQRFVFVQSN